MDVLRAKAEMFVIPKEASVRMDVLQRQIMSAISRRSVERLSRSLLKLARKYLLTGSEIDGNDIWHESSWGWRSEQFNKTGFNAESRSVVMCPICHYKTMVGSHRLGLSDFRMDSYGECWTCNYSFSDDPSMY